MKKCEILNDITKRNFSADTISYRLRLCTLWRFKKFLFLNGVCCFVLVIHVVAQ